MFTERFITNCRLANWNEVNLVALDYRNRTVYALRVRDDVAGYVREHSPAGYQSLTLLEAWRIFRFIRIHG